MTEDLYDPDDVLAADEILEAKDLTTVPVKCPEWTKNGKAGIVLIRGLDGTARDEFEAGSVKQVGRQRVQNLHNFRARLVAQCAVDANGDKLFNTKQVAALGKKSAAALDRCFSMASKLSGLSSKDVEELTGNSAAAQKEPSTSD